MVKVYNADESIYQTLEDYLEALEAAGEEELETNYLLVFMYSIVDLFTKIKQRTALRGKYLKDEGGKSLIEKVAMTNDEVSQFNDLINDAAIKIFSVFSGYARGVEDAFKFSINSIGDTLFSGSGLNDLSIRGTYTGVLDQAYVIIIDGTGTPNTFKWSDDGAQSWNAEDVAITGNWQTLSDGVEIKFNAITGHTLNDNWGFECTGGHIIYHLNLDQYMDTNLAEILDKPIERAFIHHVTGEWYESIGSPDMVMENQKYLVIYNEILGRAMHLSTNVKRPTPLF